MLLRQRVKYRWYGRRGSFPYFGTTVYFPPDSGSFRAACEQGIYEIDNTRALAMLVRPETTCFDIGANIGLMAAPLLSERTDCRVVSFEPSPGVVPYLRRTVAGSGFGDRWQLVEKALGAQSGQADFYATRGTGGLYDGLRDTHRISEVDAVQVEVSTLDIEWERLGRPAVSVVKIDVEGAEIDVFEGAKAFLAHERPAIMLEWTEKNLPAYNRQPVELLSYAASIGYVVFALPHFLQIDSLPMLELQMLRTESFLMKSGPPLAMSRAQTI